MADQIKPQILEGTWLALFPGGQIPAVDELELAEPMSSSTFELEGHEFRAVEVGHTDTYNTTVLHVPSIRLVVAGDAVYGDVHQYFGEANTTAKRQEWLRALDAIEALDPQTVIAGHKRAGTVDGLSICTKRVNIYWTLRMRSVRHRIGRSWRRTCAGDIPVVLTRMRS
jgi:glyoxylase-like metal-dependent hydrolase (beta-lactamase superfamily II)